MPTMFDWDEYSASPLMKMHAARLRHADVVRILKELHSLRPDGMSLKEIGKSYEGRAIYSATIGTGPVRVLAWSQMHGNEPTHTAVLLDLIDLLQRHPGNIVPRDILAECTLTLVPMLNPDGAERYIRRTAQDIDMNRDALHLATPEGRLLRQLVQELKPQFAFNLHNQQAGTSVDGVKVAAVSLLVPPIDMPDTQTEWTQQAKQVAGAYLDAVKPHCEGMISRYDADFMPRCFGEWIQQQEIATLTVEAGGWSTVDTGPLVQLHFVGMINSLEAIANGCYTSIDETNYDRLPRSSDQYLFDVMVRDAEIVPVGKQPRFPADLGINFTHQEDRVPVERGGRIDDFGDLCVTAGKQELAAEKLWCLPGRIVYLSSFTPHRLPTQAEAQQLLSQGVTTVIGSVNLAESAELEALAKLPQVAQWPINVGFVATAADLTLDKLTERLVRAIAAGVLGLVANQNAGAHPVLDWFNLPLLKAEELPSPQMQPSEFSELAEMVCDFAEQLGLKSRATIKLGTIADLIFFSQTGAGTFSWNTLRRVMLGGRVVIEDGKFLPGASGEFLKR